MRLLRRFRRKKQGIVCGQFLAVNQETTIKKYCENFKELVAPLPHLTNEVLKNTFMNGLKLVIKVEVLCFRPVGLEDMMEKAQLVEDKEIMREEEERPKLGMGRALRPLSPIQNKRNMDWKPT